MSNPQEYFVMEEDTIQQNFEDIVLYVLRKINTNVFNEPNKEGFIQDEWLRFEKCFREYYYPNEEKFYIPQKVMEDFCVTLLKNYWEDLLSEMAFKDGTLEILVQPNGNIIYVLSEKGQRLHKQINQKIKDQIEGERND